MNQIFDKTLRALATSNQMREVRQNVLSANVANAETPGYHAQKVDFESELKRALETENSSIETLKADIYDNPEVDVSNDGNTVDLEKEMASMVENNVMYRAANQLINKKLASLKYVSSDGGR